MLIEQVYSIKMICVK